MTAILIKNAFLSGGERFEQFCSALPLNVARARRGFGGYISLDFGAECSCDKMTQDPQFEWHMWVYMCDWDLNQAGCRVLWRRESDNAHAGTVLKKLEGETLEAIDYAAEDDCFTFIFSGGFRLHINPDFYDYDGDDEMFMLFRHGERDALAYSPRRRFYRTA